MRFLFYSHDGLGLGHTRRNLALAAALTEASPGSAVIVATGSSEVEELGVPPGVEVLRLPALRKLANGNYGSRRLALRGSKVREVRAAVLRATVESFQPSVLIADKHPLGVKGELRPALDAQRAVGGRAALGMRDILDRPAVAIREWAADGLQLEIEHYYDRILVYGSEQLLDFVGEYELSPTLAERTRFCGYVVHPSANGNGSANGRLPSPRRPVVLGTAGGGEDGYAMLRAFIEAAHGTSWEAGLVCGPRCTVREKDSLARLASHGSVRTGRFVRNLSDWFPKVDALVCMGGYNTLTEAVAMGTPTVCVPRVSPRSEQLIRARAFAGRGLLRFVRPDGLDPTRLRAEVAAVLAGPPRAVLAERARANLGLSGARVAARHLLELAQAAPAQPLAAAL